MEPVQEEWAEGGLGGGGGGGGGGGAPRPAAPPPSLIESPPATVRREKYSLVSDLHSVAHENKWRKSGPSRRMGLAKPPVT